MSKDVSEVLFSAEDIAERVEQLGREITAYYEQKGVRSLLMVAVLRGSVIFFSDLARRISLPDLQFDFMTLSSYGSATDSSGRVDMLTDITEKVFDRDVLIVEDIIDTGLTMSEIIRCFEEKGVRSLTLVTLLDKPSRRKTPELKIDFCGFQVPDEFLVGYGLDYAGRYRQLPYIGVLKPSVYKK